MLVCYDNSNSLSPWGFIMKHSVSDRKKVPYQQSPNGMVFLLKWYDLLDDLGKTITLFNMQLFSNYLRRDIMKQLHSVTEKRKSIERK